VAKATEHGISNAYQVEELLRDPSIDIVVNLTVPEVHAAVTIKALEAGKHVYSEKPLAIKRDDGKLILETAAERGLLVGCAPDTFLGGGLQTCRKLIDDGLIGRPVGATAFMMSHGPEGWHPNPHFFYQEGAGPLFDMAPYYLTAMIHLLGPIHRITSSNRISFPERVATSEANYGQRIPVTVPTYVAALLNFEAGPIGTLITTFDVWSSELPRIEIYGSEGSLSVPDPNTFTGPVRLRRADDESWRDVPLTHSDTVRRGIGVADMAHGLTGSRPHRASGEMAFHVLDAMAVIEEASQVGQHISLMSSCPQPSPLPLGLPIGVLD
jgi:predicted dehydrogenase